MFEALSQRLQTVFRTLRGHGHLTEAEIREGLREIRMALLEADVHLQVVKDLMERVREKAGSEEILRSLNPAQHVIKLVRDEMVAILDQGAGSRLAEAPQPPTVIMMAGLQGSGKTTTVGKLARHLKERDRSPLLVAGDVRRPAAVEQLQVLGRQIGVPVVAAGAGGDAATACREALRDARQSGRSPVIVDTAGRLHIDDELMAELAALKELCRPTEILYVADSMTGQDAVRSAAAFHARLKLTGIILTKTDGDARGGAALSLRHVTGVPIKFTGTGEHLEDLEPFHADRLVSRLLGMGDVLTLIEKAQAQVSAEEAQDAARRMRKSELTFDDLAEQLDRMGKMGSIQQLMGLLPGGAALSGMEIDESGLKKARAIIGSMTGRERRDPAVLDGGRRLRIARGSGTSVNDVNRLVKQFKQMKRMMKSLQAGGSKARLRQILGAGRSFSR
jgi:signal recognition particle subunit SRP54